MNRERQRPDRPDSHPRPTPGQRPEAPGLTARIAGGDLSFDVQGSGVPLLFLHAFPLGLSMWDDQAKSLADIARVVRFDDRGFGGSSLHDGTLGMDRIADDAAALLDHLGIDKA